MSGLSACLSAVVAAHVANKDKEYNDNKQKDREMETKYIRERSPIYTVSQKTCDYIFCNNFNNRCPITIIFGIVSSKSMRHRKMVSFPTSPV